MSKRTDLHRPSVIVPNDYIFIACDYYGSGAPHEFFNDRLRFRAHMQRTGGKHAHITRTEDDDGSKGCDICGAKCLYVARFYHKPTNSYLTTGMDCAEKMHIDNPVVFKSFRARVAAGLKLSKGINKARELLGAAGVSDAFELSRDITSRKKLLTDRIGGNVRYEEATIHDIVGKVVQYGNVSEAQVRFLRNLMDKIANREVVAAQRAAAEADYAPIPVTDKRITICGTIVSAKVSENDFGSVMKILVQHSTGWKVWGNAPADLLDSKDWNSNGSTLRGAKVQFDARVTVSDNDTKFGFFSRPTKASMLEEATA